MSKWHPISTAPTDRKILTHGPAGYRIAQWDDDQYASKPKPRWTWWYNSKQIERLQQPTHWMLLPDPPKEP